MQRSTRQGISSKPAGKTFIKAEQMTMAKVRDQARFFNQELEIHNKSKSKDDKKKSKDKDKDKKTDKAKSAPIQPVETPKKSKMKTKTPFALFK